MNPYNRRSYSGTAPDTSLATGVDNATLTVTVADATGWPDGTAGPFAVIFEPDTSSEEKCWASARSGNTITLLARGMEGAALAHAASTTVRHGLSAKDVDEANYAVSQTVGQIQAKGDLLVGSAANTFTKVAKGTAGQVPVWQSDGSIAPGKPTLAESDITGLVNDLAAKMGNPSTAWAKGSVLAGTGTNTYDTTAVGGDGTVLTADSTATGGVSWQTPTAGLLTTVDYTSTSSALSTTALTAVDTTNLSPSFTVPSSGRVLIRVSGACLDNSGASAATLTFGWKNHTGGAQVGRSQNLGLPGTSSSIYDPRFAVAQTLTGLSAGSTLQLDFAAQSTVSSVKVTDVTIEVWSA